jgi:general secretion pathway protein C
MARYASWLVNAALAVLACFFVAQGANSVFAALLTEVPTGEPATATAPAAPAGRAWSDYEVILTRNLFNASTLEPPPVAVPEELEELEATQLPLTLLGTAAADDPEISWAAIEDRESQQTLVLHVDDTVRNQAVVRRIERRRIVLEEKGVLRELALEEPADLAASPAAPIRPMARARPAPRRPPASPLPSPLQPAELPVAADEGLRSPARLFSEARILPKYEEGQMVGVQVSAIKPGSLFEKMGIQEGEVITELNGIRIDSPEQSAKILLELTRSQEFTIQVEGAGGTRSLNAALPEP